MSEMPLEIERKYLIRRPDPAFLADLPDCRVSRIVQTYLLPEGDGFGRRVRQRSVDGGAWEYTYTRKKRLGAGTHIELEDVIPLETYAALLEEADPEMHPIEKYRCCIPHAGFLLELDVYAFDSAQATLEIELPSIDTPVTLPDWVEVIADVTERRGFSNFALAKTLRFPKV
ncbi:MAG: hypothetical protein IJ055_00795 [Oscillospiraceae bacterium]|nr:hypothetical protein [Oscillospiraceae bacterium]